MGDPTPARPATPVRPSSGPALWTMTGGARPEAIPDLARRAEADGWDGMYVHDSQNLWADPFVSMTLAAGVTDTLQLGIAATNPGTRHPAAMAAAIASVAVLAPDRVSLGIARGDSALAQIGSAPVKVADFERYVSIVRRYLHGASVALDELVPWRPGRDISTLPCERPDDSRLRWRLDSDPEVPIEVFATGPRMIDVAVRLGDRVTFGLGADVDRLRWGVEQARRIHETAGIERELRLGAFLHVAVTDDVERGVSLLSNTVAVVARFSSLHGRPVGPTPPEQRVVFENIAKTYDTNHHAERVAHADALPSEFIETLAVVGPPARCVERLQELAALGLDHFMVAVPTAGPGSAESAELYAAFLDVMSELRSLTN